MVRVLFICLGNICRSPTAQGVFEKLVQERNLANQFEVDSAGTHGYHTGGKPDRRATEAAALRGIDLSRQRARVVVAEDFVEFDYLVAMDRSNLAHLISMMPNEAESELVLATQFAPDFGFDEVPDPYYGGASGFEQVLDLLEIACDGLLAHIHSNKQ